MKKFTIFYYDESKYISDCNTCNQCYHFHEGEFGVKAGLSINELFQCIEDLILTQSSHEDVEYDICVTSNDVELYTGYIWHIMNEYENKDLLELVKLMEARYE